MDLLIKLIANLRLADRADLRRGRASVIIHAETVLSFDENV